MEDAHNELVASVYQAPHREGGWERFFDLLMHHSDSRSGVLGTEAGTTGTNVKPLIHDGFNDKELEDWANHYVSIDPWIESMSSLPHNVFYRADSIFPREQFLKSEIFNDFSSRQDRYYASDACITTQGTDHSIQITLQRGKKQGEHLDDQHELLNLLVPHIQQALWLDSMLQPIVHHEKIVVDSIAAPAFICDRHRKVMHLNEQAEQLCRHSTKVRLRAGVLTLQDHKVARQYNDAMSEMAGSILGLDHSKLIRFDENQQGFVIRIVPWNNVSSDFSLCVEQTLVVIKPIDGKLLSNTQMFKHVFGLSNREAEVGVFLAAGLKPQEVADELLILESTVRTHIKALLRKTNSRSVQRMVALFHSADSSLK